jgi:hypothetical protein
MSLNETLPLEVIQYWLAMEICETQGLVMLDQLDWAWREAHTEAEQMAKAAVLGFGRCSCGEPHAVAGQTICEACYDEDRASSYEPEY